MEIPTVGGARGVFEIFVPGLFLLANLLFGVCFCPGIGSVLRARVWQLLDKEILAIATAVVFGYLIGVLLRLLRCESLDSLSAKWLKCFDSDSRETVEGGTTRFKEYVTDTFPYFNWLKRLCVEKYGSKNASAFFERTWNPAESEHKVKHNTDRNRQFFNFRKMRLVSANASGAAEVNAAEAFTRYMSLMFFALVTSTIAMGAVGLTRFVVKDSCWHFCVLAFVYLVSAALIVRNFRSIRIKEVETLFVADLQLSEVKQPTV